MHKPREKWVTLTGGHECECSWKMNLETGDQKAKLCFYHQKLRKRWEEWAARPNLQEITAELKQAFPAALEKEPDGD